MKLAIRELRNNPLWSILGLIICFICFNTVFASLTNIGASVYQRKEFEENINIDLNKANNYFNNQSYYVYNDKNYGIKLMLKLYMKFILIQKN